MPTPRGPSMEDEFSIQSVDFGSQFNTQMPEFEHQPMSIVSHSPANSRPMLWLQSLEESTHFYTSVLGIERVARPSSFTFPRVWLHRHGIAGQRLVALGIDAVRQTIVEAGVVVHQIFFHDPDGYMVEICSCTNLMVVPI
ncbi:hypothetical protein SASPL_127059 [Salvia splendens]|uniref:VOC domain-containing protein n=1 Tax=Salvia splendens TaxID=180675 RepID=A0A8X8XKN9_SALSN|nr:hypothetical protein SASPL_127059 [Salvia splendens]